MAEFCRKCFIETFRPSKEEEQKIIMSEESDLCEGCGEVKPFVLYVAEKVCQVKSEFT